MMIKVLVIDDDKLARKGLISIFPFEQYGMTVVGDVQNGRAGLEFLENCEVDLAFVDIDMPEMNGLEFMKESKKRYPDLQFVVLTFYEDFKYAQQALRLGALDYVSKIMLETEDYHQMLTRIVGVMKQKESHVKQMAQTAEFDENLWNQVAEEWKKKYWLYYDQEFVKLCKLSRNISNVLWRIHHLMVWLLRQIECESGFEYAKLPEVDCMDSIIDWIRDWRKNFLNWCQHSESLDYMEACMVKALQYVRDHIDTSLHTEVVAERFGLSRSYFSINFKKLTGVNFHECVRKERMKAAKQLLKDTNKTVLDISQLVGYEDVNYFNKVFLDEEKITPTAYRKEEKFDNMRAL